MCGGKYIPSRIVYDICEREQKMNANRPYILGYTPIHEWQPSLIWVFVLLHMCICVCSFVFVSPFFIPQCHNSSRTKGTQSFVSLLFLSSSKQTNMQIHTHIHTMAARGVLGDHPPIRLMIRSSPLFAVNVNIRIGGL